MTAQRLPRLAHHSWQVVHHIPGRVRVRIPAMASAASASASESKLRTALEQMAGIRSVRINRAAGCIAISYHPTAEATLQTLLVTLEEQQRRASPVLPLAQTPKQQKKPTGEWEGLKLPVLAAGLTLAGRWLPGLRSLALLSLLAAVFPVGQRAAKSLVIERKFNIDCLDLLALSLGACQGKLLTPALVLTLHELGDAIREQTARTTAVQAANLEDAIGHFAWVKETPDSPPRQIPSEQVQVGQTVVVYPGEQIPVDGVVLSGDAVIDQQSLTGEAMPVAGRVGTQVYASTLARSGQIHIRAERVGRNTRAAAGLELLRQAPAILSMTNDT